MKKIVDTLKRKWAEYLLEILVIIFGVLIAFWLQGWRQDLTNNKTQKVLLNGLIADLTEDSEDISQFINSCKSRNESAQLIFSQDLSNEERLNHARNLGFTSRLEIVESTFQEMSNSGAIQSIKDDELRLMITSYYGFARDRLDVNEIILPEILRFRSALEDMGYPYKGGSEIPVKIINHKKISAIVKVLGDDAGMMVPYVAGLKKVNQELLDRIKMTIDE